MSKLDLHDIRQDYCRQELSETDCASQPLEQFRTWLDAAMHAQVHEPTAMNVATVDEHGHPNARIVLLKEVNDQGFVFFTNYQSRKGRAIALHPYVALTFFWPELERQVRVEGSIDKLPESGACPPSDMDNPCNANGSRSATRSNCLRALPPIFSQFSGAASIKRIGLSSESERKSSAKSRR